MVSYIKGTADAMGTITHRTEDDICANKRRLKNK
jgi:hypothetical protein